MSAAARAAAARLGVATVLTGVAAGLGGAALTVLLHLVQHLAYGYSEGRFLAGVERASGTRRVLVLALAGVLAGVGWWALRARTAPVPRIGAAVRSGVRLPLPPVGLDAGLQVVVVALGASLGREGAPRQLGAALGARLAELARLEPAQRGVLLACGAGAGLAAVYDVPVGGALFTVEVLLVTARPRVLLQAAVTSGVAALVARLLLEEPRTYLVRPGRLSAALLLWALVAGPLLAGAAAAFVRLTDAASGHRPRGPGLLRATVPVFTALGLLAVAYPQLLGNGKGPAQLAFDDALPWGTLAALALLKPLVTAACLRSGATGGRLTPALATGALLGAVLGRLGRQLAGGLRPGDCALVGAGAFLAVTLQAPLTAVALVLELSAPGPALLPPLAVAATAATATVAGVRAVGRRGVAGRRLRAWV